MRARTGLLGAAVVAVAAAGQAAEVPAGGRTSALAVTVPGESDRFVVVLEPEKRKILAYRAGSSGLRLVAARSYLWDLKLRETPRPKGAGFSQVDAEKLVRAKLSREEIARPVGGREELLAAGGAEGQGARFVVVNQVAKRILLYRLDRNALHLLSARSIESDALATEAGSSGAEPERKVNALIEQLGHRLSSVRSAAARSLADIDPPPREALDALKKALADEKAAVREAAAEAVRRIEAAAEREAEAGTSPGGEAGKEPDRE
jgi:hypothetical protein